MRGATRRAPAPLLVPAVVLLLAAGLTACAGGATATAEEPVTAALCGAMDAADGATAAEIFERDAHPPLHDLADEVADVDRGLAGALLEAKFAVETLTRSDTDAPEPLLRQRLADLDVEVRRALDALDRAPTDC